MFLPDTYSSYRKFLQNVVLSHVVCLYTRRFTKFLVLSIVFTYCVMFVVYDNLTTLGKVLQLLPLIKKEIYVCSVIQLLVLLCNTFEKSVMLLLKNAHKQNRHDFRVYFVFYIRAVLRVFFLSLLHPTQILRFFCVGSLARLPCACIMLCFLTQLYINKHAGRVYTHSSYVSLCAITIL